MQQLKCRFPPANKEKLGQAPSFSSLLIVYLSLTIALKYLTLILLQWRLPEKTVLAIQQLNEIRDQRHVTTARNPTC